ncbi:MAG TPA: DUF3352 domain-containing protein [Pyrinomonadaceae bacterium]|nr:DUF3352 domain-containing protein [Pyrinomonadaceae bacterium]
MRRLKRKPFLFGIGAAAVLLALAASQFAGTSRAGSPRLERYLPAETVGFVEVNDLRAQAVRIIESEAWREFVKENQAASSLFMITANHAGALDASYAVALLGAGAGGPEFVALAEFDDSGARRTFERRVLNLARGTDGQGAKTTTEEYEGVKINHVARGEGPGEGKGRGEGRGFVYARVENSLYLSNSAAAVKRALDVRGGRAASLETNETFRRARAAAGANDGMFGFLDGAALTRVVDAVPDGAEGKKGAAAFRQFFRGVGADSVRSVAFTSTFEDGRVAERFYVTAPERSGVLATVAANPPTTQALLDLVPEDALAAFDASVANAPQAFDHLLALAAEHAGGRGGKGPAEGLAEFAAKTGVDFRAEVVGALGGEVCLAQLPDGEGRLGVFVLNVKDPAAFEQTLRKVAASKGGTVAEREFRGVRVGRVTGEQGHGFEFAFVGGTNVVLSGEGRGVERVIETAQGGRSLRSSAAYAAASAGATGAQFVYFNTNADYLGRLGRVLKSGGAEGVRTEARGGSLRPSFAYGATRPEGFVVESRTPLGTFPRLLTVVATKFGGAAEEQASVGAQPSAEAQNRTSEAERRASE